jgi:hypothetical protein
MSVISGSIHLIVTHLQLGSCSGRSYLRAKPGAAPRNGGSQLAKCAPIRHGLVKVPRSSPLAWPGQFNACINM